ncbi:MAG: hypothetical protein JOZ32_07745 [Bryobacterales bacterium]|nr:hypothetical protein [Bryobacterales bacterium]
MSDESKAGDLGCIWRNQPEEKLPVNLEQIMNRRTEELFSSTRWEILMTIGAALLLVGVAAWRLQIAHEGLLEFGFAAVIAWVAISLYWFRRRIWPGDSSGRNAIAVTGLEYYRRELERRRDHLRNGWLWYGPLSLASVIFIAVWTGRANMSFRPLGNVMPLFVLLAASTGFGIWRRRLHASELQREIDEIRPLASAERSDQK